jgi:hypothetical protein
MLAFDID